MKSSLIFRFSLLLLVFASTLAHAPPTPTPTPTPAAQPGYWNIETNLTTRDYTTVRYYNAHDQLVYEKQLPNFCLDLSRPSALCRHTKGQIDLALQQVLAAPASQPAPAGLLAQQLGQSHRALRVYAAR